jgi:hypothetical protein
MQSYLFLDIAQGIEKSPSPTNEALKVLTSALSVVATESQMVAQALEWLQQEFK